MNELKSRLARPVLPGRETLSMIHNALVHEVTGRVAAIVGENVEVEGMSAPLGAICELHTGGTSVRLQVIGFRAGKLIAAPLQRLRTVAAGDVIRLVDFSSKLRVGPALCGRIIDAFGQPLDQRSLPIGLASIDTDAAAPATWDRPPIDTALQTGIRAIDSLLTVGRGQRLGIFAGSGVGKSTLLGMLARGCAADRIVVALVGERGREVQEFVTSCLGDDGFARTIVVAATSDSPAAQRVAAASAATAIAESFRDSGEDVLLLFDSITRYAMAQRELGLAAGQVPTARGYPPSVFNQLPQLIERAGRTGRGSITAFYTVLVEADDMNDPIADAMRGLLDGHIMLSRPLASEAHWPPIDVLESLSRAQPQVTDANTMAAAAQIRTHLAEYRRHADLISIGAYQSGSDPKVDAAIAMRDPIQSFLRQGMQEQFAIDQSQQQLQQLVAEESDSRLDRPAA